MRASQPRFAAMAFCTVTALFSGCASRPAAPPVTVDPSYHLIMGEMALTRGKLHVAVDQYREAARRLKDAEVTRRAMQVAIHANDLSHARMLADEWEALAPDDPELAQYQGILQLRAGRKDEAYRYLLQVVDGASDEAVAANLQMLTSMLAGEDNIWRAADLMARLAKSRPERAEGWHGAALLALEAQRPQAALQFAERAIALDPDMLDAAFLRARAWLIAHPGTDEVRKVLAPLDEYRNSSDSGLRYRYASLLVLAGRYEQADALFEDILVNDPRQHDARLARALLAMDTGRHEAAEAELHRLLELHGRPQEALFYLGVLEEQRGRPAGALQWYGRVAPEVPGLETWLNAQSAQARIMLGTDGLAAAQGHFDALRAQWPELAGELLVDEAALLSGNGLAGEALARIERLAGESGNRHRELDWQIGLALAETGQLDRAEKVFRALLSNDPGNPLVLNALAFVLLERDDRLTEAEQLLVQAHQAAPANPSVLATLGWLRFRQGRAAAARPLLEESWQREPALSTGLHLLGVLRVLQDTDAAEAFFNELKRQFPGLEMDEEIG